MSTRVDLTVAGGVAWITLDGPDTRNALDLESVGALVEACERIDGDPSVGAAVITGAGAGFCAGADRAVLAATRQLPATERDELLRSLYAGFRRFGALAVPSVAAVNGAAVGAGVNLALAADLRVMAADAVLTSGFARIGIHPGGGHLHLLDRAANSSVAAAMGVFARTVAAADAVRLGLAWTMVPASELRSTVTELVAHLADEPDLARALAATLRASVRSMDPWDRAIEIELQRQSWSLSRPPKES